MSETIQPIDEAPEGAPLPVRSVADILAAATKQTGERLTEIAVPEWDTTIKVRPLTRSEIIWIQEQCVDQRTGKKDLVRGDRETFCRMVVQPKFRKDDYQALLDSEPAARVLSRIHIRLATVNDGIERDEQGEPVRSAPSDPMAAAEARFQR